MSEIKSFLNRRVEMWPVTRLKQNPRNARKHPAKQIDAIIAGLRRFGWYSPIAADGSDNEVIIGHGRLEAAIKIGEKEVPVIDLSDLSKQEQRELLLVDNAVFDLGGWDKNILEEELRLLKSSGSDLAVFGLEAPGGEFAPKEVEEIRTVDTFAVADEFWISIRGPMRDQAMALKILKDCMGVLPEVNVEIGTRAWDGV